MDYEQLKAMTADKVDELKVKPCDMFTETLSYWELVLEVTPHTISVMNSNDWEIKDYRIEEWQKHCSYDTIKGHWITFIPTDDEMVKKFFYSYYDHLNSEDNDPKKRESKINQILLEDYPEIWKIIKNEEFVI